MQNKKLIALIVLGIAAIFSLIYGIVTPSRIRHEISKKSTDIKEQALPTAEIKTALTTNTGRARRTNFSTWGQDPFSSGPAVSSPSTISDMILTGILWDDTAPLAMINDNPIGVGDKIGGYTVVEIHKDRVILTDGTKTYELRLPTY